MIPVSLTIKGLYSYQAEQTIDFTRLTQSHVFGIFGKTGSGKSSILEAITFALYGEVDRLGVKDERNYNMMNQKSKDLLVDFTFLHTDGLKYRFKVTTKRNGKNYDDVKTPTRVAYKQNGTSWESMEHSDGEALLGMSYQNFRRTIIIPQGKFQEFLELKDADRTRMLKEIFHLDKFEFDKQTAVLVKETTERLDNLNGQLVQFESVTQEAIDEKTISVSALNNALVDQRKTLESKQAQLNALVETKKQFDELANKKAALQLLETDEPKHKQLKKKLDDYDACFKNFKHNLDRRKELNASIALVTTRLTNVNTEIESNDEKLESTTKAFTDIQKDFESLDWWKDELHDCGQLVELLKLRDASTLLDERIAKGNAILKTQQEKTEQLRNDVDALVKDLDAQTKNLPELVSLKEAQHWFVQKEQIDTDIAKLELQIKSTDADNFQTEHTFITKLVNRFGDEIHFDKTPSLANIEPSLKAYLKQRHQFIGELTIELQDLTHTKKLGEYADALQDGDPCPLCGSTEHPNILKVEEVAEQIELVERDIEGNRQRIELCNEALTTLAKTQIQIKERLTQRTQHETALTEKQALLQAHVSKFTWKGFSPDNRKQVDKAFTDANSLHKQVDALRLKIEAYRKSLDGANKDCDKYKNALVKFGNEAAGLESQRAVRIKELKQLKFDAQTPDIDTLKLRSSELKQTVERTEKQHKLLQTELQQLQTSKQVLAERKSSAEKELTQLNEQLVKTEEGLRDCLKSSSLAKLEEVEAILAETIDLKTEKAKLERFYQQLFAAQKAVKELNDQLQHQSFDEAALQTLTEEVTTIHQAVQKLNDNLVREKAFLQELTTKLTQKQTIQKERATVQQRADGLATLVKLFKGSGFVNFVSTRYLQSLCSAANDRFRKLVRSHFTLTLNETNNFLVKDHYNEDKLRDVKTLSGGQKFQAALSLALALAQHVQEQNKSQQNFFFLDEGFGSLDKDSLDLVFETLMTLRKENRIVGIISHVEQLQDQIDTYLEVTNDQESGSKIRSSWN